MEALLIVFALVAPAAAADPNLFAIVDMAAPANELQAWGPVVNRFAPGTPMPAPDAIGVWLGKLVGVPEIKGVDPKKPLHLALVNPQTNPQPLVLVLPVKDAKALVASVQPSLE